MFDPDTMTHDKRSATSIYYKKQREKTENNNQITSEIPSPYSSDIQQEIKSERDHCERLRNKFLSKYEQADLDKYVYRWAKNVNGFDFGQTLYEYPALIDFFEAVKFGEKDVIERAIEVGQSKKRQ